MIYTVFECSTAKPTIALYRDEEKIGLATWENRFRENRLHEEYDRLLQENKMSLSDVDTYVVGIGPGQFTGLRIALASAMGYAAPHKKQLYPVSSGEALAFAHVQENPFHVVGDARRKHLWVGTFSGSKQNFSIIKKWHLVPHNTFTPEGKVLSPDAERLPQLSLKPDFPNASMVMDYARYRMQHHLPPDRPEPVYLHPAVSG